MTVVRLERRLGALEARHDLASMRFDHLSDDQLEAKLKFVRADLLDALEDRGIELPPEWYQWTQAQQDMWVTARIEELPE